MAHGPTLRQLAWTLAVGLAAVSLLGLECQYEPLPDERRGFVGDRCRVNNTCEPCDPLPDGGCGNLICAAEEPPRCRRECPLGDAPGTCGYCGPQAKCLAVPLSDGGMSTGVGACVPAPQEGDPCGSGNACAGCLQCATDPSTQARSCRRACDNAIDAGPWGFGITAPHPHCGYSDRAETGALVLNNCCLYGQRCEPVAVESTPMEICFGPLPFYAGGTCRPQVGVAGPGACDRTSALCVEGNDDAGIPIPNHCVHAGGVNEPCRQNNTCDPLLTCIADDKFGHWPICRRNCSTAPESCAFCGPDWACVPVLNAPVGNGVCVPGVNENGSCNSGEFCSNCTVCGGMAGQPNSNKCRRGCLSGVTDAGTIPGPPPAACRAPDDAGVLANCCLPGQTCREFTGGSDGGVAGGAACYE